MKSKRKKTPDYRWWAGGLIVLAVIAILGLKALSAGPTASAVPLKQPIADLTLPTTTVLPAMGPVAPTAQRVAPQTIAQASEQPPTPRVQEPMPKDPGGQVEWAFRNKKPMMILFHSTNCIPCKIMEKLVSKVRVDYEPGIVFVDVITNDRANSELIRQARIQAIPTAFFLKTSGQSKRFVGAMKEEALRAELANLLEKE